MPGAIDQMRPSMSRRFCRSDRRQMIIAWATPIVFIVTAFSLIIYHDDQFLRRKTVKSMEGGPTETPAPPVDWASLPWKQAAESNVEKRSHYGIQVHGKPTEAVVEAYTKEVRDFKPRHVDLNNIYFSPDGHVVYKKQPYPDTNPYFGAFDRTSMSGIADENVTLDRMIPVQSPPEMSALDSLMYIMPLLFSIPESELEKSVLAVPRRFIDFEKVFRKELLDRLNITILHSIWAESQTAKLIEIPDRSEISVSCLLRMAKHILAYEAEPLKSFVLAPGGNRKLKIYQTLGQLKGHNITVDEREPTSDIPAIMNELTKHRGVIGFTSRFMELASFMRPGSIVIEVQKPDYVSRAAIVAASMGMRVHVFIEKNGTVNIDEMAEVMKSIVNKP